MGKAAGGGSVKMLSPMRGRRLDGSELQCWVRGWVIGLAMGWKLGGCEPDREVVGITGVGYEMGIHIPLGLLY